MDEKENDEKVVDTENDEKAVRNIFNAPYTLLALKNSHFTNVSYLFIASYNRQLSVDIRMKIYMIKPAFAFGSSVLSKLVWILWFLFYYS